MLDYDGFYAWRTCRAVSLHFSTQSYDFFKYRGKIRNAQTAFEKTKNKFFFRKVENKIPRDIFPWFFACHKVRDVQYIRDMISDEGISIFRAAQAVVSASKRSALQALKKFDGISFNDVFKCNFEEGKIAHLYQAYLDNNISPEEIVLINNIVPFLDWWDADLLTNVQTLRKYQLFLPKKDLSSLRDNVKSMFPLVKYHI